MQVPFPGSLCSAIVPRCSCTACLTIESPSPVPPENDEYGRISHPKKPLVTGTLYAVALAAVVAAAVLLSKIF